MTRAPLALTLGDPDGVGPEISLKAWRDLRHDDTPFALFADPDQIGSMASRLGLPAPICVESPAQAVAVFPDTLPVIALTASSNPADAAIRSIDAAVAATLAGAFSGVATNPVSKSVLYEAGFRFPGHTEYIAHLSADAPMPGARGPVMMLAGGGLRCALVTIHQPLRQAIEALTPEAVIRTATVAAQALARDFAIDEPRLAIAGLNPHAGEGGALGREEIDILAPAIAALKAMGHDIIGPLPPDTMFHAEARTDYDAAICLYHDQGLIPVKTLDFHGGVNATLGLPLIRTSPDHGTAFDIAGKGIARPDSLIAAIKLAAELAANRAAA